MSRKILIGITLGLILVLIPVFLNDDAGEVREVCFESNCFSVEIADSEGERNRGLMHRSSLPEDEGMFFVFETEGVYSFWMKNTLIPLDIIWLDKSREIVFMSENTPPCDSELCDSYDSGKFALYVLEINGGVADKIGLKIGDKLNFKFSFFFFWKGWLSNEPNRYN